MLLLVFFFKQKTAYEMRISDWSSDVCSSDLPVKHDVSDPCHYKARYDGHARRRRGPAFLGDQNPIDQKQEAKQKADCQQAIGRECERSKGEGTAHSGPSRGHSLSETYAGYDCYKQSEDRREGKELEVS